jgi:hypothetical protein
MSTTETVRVWSVTAANNASADSAISSSDNQSPATLDNNIRSIMAAVRKAVLDISGNVVAGGSANAITAVTNGVLESAQITDGLYLKVRAASANTSTTVTFAPDGLTAANVKRADSSASEWRAANIPPATNLGQDINAETADATPDPFNDYLPTYDASATTGKKTLLKFVGGLVFLTSGTASGATLDIVLTSYTGYRGLKIFLSGFRPATNDVALWMRFSTDGGSTYDASGYNYALQVVYDAPATGSNGSGSDVAIVLTSAAGAGLGVGNASTAGYNGEITLLNQTSTAFWCRVQHTGYFISAQGTPSGCAVTGGGAREAAQDTDAIRFLFSSGNITSGNYVVYGLV